MMACIMLLTSSKNLFAQQPVVKRLQVNEVITMAKNNLQYGINNQQMLKGKALVKTANMFPKTGVFTENEDIRPSDRKGILKVGISQSIAWPGL